MLIDRYTMGLQSLTGYPSGGVIRNLDRKSIHQPVVRS
jgi:hypothetical protein